jgi:hypothetical protein
MSQLQSWIVSFVCLLGLTTFCSYIGDDDVVYEFFDRKPTPREAIIRVRWVYLWRCFVGDYYFETPENLSPLSSIR